MTKSSVDIRETLYELVKNYSDMGIHRVGTKVDKETINWFDEKLKALGAETELQTFEFQRFEGKSKVLLNGKEIPSLPLYYEAIGEITTQTPHVVQVPVLKGDSTNPILEDAILSAKAVGSELLIVAVDNKVNQIASPNRAPELGSGLPVALVQKEYYQPLKAAQGSTLKVHYNARMHACSSENIVGYFGKKGHNQKPILLATPLSGWFNCAAERATGIAVAFSLAQRLSKEYPVMVVGSPGHEILNYIGVEAFAKQNDIDPEIIIHLGANVALGVKDPKSGEFKLAPGVNDASEIVDSGRSLYVRMNEDKFDLMKPALATADLPAVLNPSAWNGEAGIWSKESNAPLLSFVGTGPLFHTPMDVPENVTSQQILAQIDNAIYLAIKAYME
ncbi:hypothetical protein [Zooshikella sp. RANM57]|uniref:hypothetical protein n=1 Tax=Zooshikella sp. RANM57 TaxID=3425863 RepID=UPI003D6EA364